MLLSIRRHRDVYPSVLYILFEVTPKHLLGWHGGKAI